MTNRKEGWYWVHDGNEWIPLEYKGDEWWDSGRKARLWLGEGSGATIGDRIPTPDEMEDWQAVPKEPTLGMLNEGHRKMFGRESGPTSEVYRAMLQAAPKPGDA